MRIRSVVLVSLMPLATACAGAPAAPPYDGGTSPAPTADPTADPGPGPPAPPIGVIDGGPALGYDGGPIDLPPIACDIACIRGTHIANGCTCVPDNPRCADTGICGPGLHWDFAACACEPNATGCKPFACPGGQTINPQTCGCDFGADGGLISPPAGCDLPGQGVCPRGEVCVVGYCADNTPQNCYCGAAGLACKACPPTPGPIEDGGPVWDAGPPTWDAGPPTWDAGPPVFDSGVPEPGCFLGNGYCAAGTSCIIGYCPDQVTPVSCYCEGNGTAYCTGGCAGGGVFYGDAGTPTR